MYEPSWNIVKHNFIAGIRTRELVLHIIFSLQNYNEQQLSNTIYSVDRGPVYVVCSMKMLMFDK